MRLVWIGAAALLGAAACALFAPMPAAPWLTAGILLGFVLLLVRGVASVRSGLIEPTAWRSGDANDRRVALSFDDGPHPVWTPRILDALRARGVRATFFVLGSNVRAHPALVERIAAEGHDLGCHGDSHSPWTAFFRPSRMAREIEDCRAAVRAVTGLTPRFYRPPYGIRSPAHTGLTAALGLVVVGMARRGHDKDRGATPESVVRRTLDALRGGEIVALHDGDEHGRAEAVCAAADALPGILDGLAARGLEPVAVSSLLGERPHVESPSRRWTGRTHGGRVGNWIFAQWIRWGGVGAASVLLAFVSAWFVLAKGDQRRASVALRRRIHGPAPWPVEAWWAYRHFFVYGRTLVWRQAATQRRAAAPQVEYEGFEQVRAVIESPGPVLLVSAHLGDWSGACRHLEAENRRPVSVVAYRGVGLGPHQVREAATSAQFHLIDVEAPAADVGIAIASALAAGGAVALHADRTMDDDQGIRVPFLGGEATFPAGVWKVAMVTGAPAVVYFAIPLAADRVLVRACGTIRVPRVSREGRDAAVRQAAAAFACCVEGAVRRYPLHWGNFYDFWRAS